MNTERARQTNSGTQQETRDGTSSPELVAVVTVLVFVVIAAASVLIATPQSFQAAASAQPIVQNATVNEPPERPFHERYPVRPSGDSIDAPTF
jgi:hypothetical protein